MNPNPLVATRMARLCLTLAVLLAALLLAGCKVALPEITSATVTRYSAGVAGPAHEIGPAQRAAMAAWFEARPAGWRVSTGTYSPTLEVRLVHPDQSASLIHIAGSRVIVTGPFGQYERRTSAAAMAQLRRSTQPNPPKP